MTDYRDAGVDIDRGDEFVRRISPLVHKTFGPEVLEGLGGFGGLFRFPAERYREPVLVSGTDGVGTKVKIATMMGKHDTIGIDLVAMCVNDIIVSGAEPLFFLDYLATGHLDVSAAEALIKGIINGCVQAECALIGGETAEMPSCYPSGEYDLAGFAVGVVERSKMLGKTLVKSDDILIGVGSTGLHSNGYSLARKVCFQDQGWKADTSLPALKATIGETLLTPTQIYVKLVKALLAGDGIHGFAHITGGGLTGNIPRIFSDDCQAVIDRTAWTPLPVFSVLQDAGKIEREEMYRVFNMGIGLVIVCARGEASRVMNVISDQGLAGFLLGQIRPRPSGGAPLLYSH